jgi:hypothetical protein
MKIPEFRPSYMAIIAGLASDLPPGSMTPAMTHLSWDEFSGRVLERRSSRENRNAQPGLRPWWVKALVRKVLGRIE